MQIDSGYGRQRAPSEIRSDYAARVYGRYREQANRRTSCDAERFMVDIPDEDDMPGQGKRQISDRKPTGKPRRPDKSEAPTDKQNRDDKRTAPVKRRGIPPKRRPTQMLSLEPPKRNRGPSLSKGGTRMDSIGSPSTKSQRNQSLFGRVGREGKDKAPQGHIGGKEGQRPRVRRQSSRQGPVSLGGSKDQVDSMIIRRKQTRRIPKKDGTGFTSDTAPLESMGSDRRPPVSPQQQKPPQRRVDPGPQSSDVPPPVNMPVPRADFTKRDAAPPGQKGNTLAGVSAEDLLGEEGKQLLENMRQREQSPPQDPPSQQRPGAPLKTRPVDSSRQVFHAVEYSADSVMKDVTPKDELSPQNSFLSGPGRPASREVLQTPVPAGAPSDDLGYKRPVDYGDARRPTGAVDDEEPVARESTAHDEMEQRAGYMLWLQGVITREEVEDAMASSPDLSEEVQDMLAESTFTDQITLYRFLARHESVAPIDLTQIEPSEKALAALRPSIARAYRVVPIAKLNELLLVAASFPFNPKRLLELRRLTASKVKMYIVTDEEINDALTTYYPGGQVTLRSPKPEGIDVPQAVSGVTDTGNVTGDGDALMQNYDPTLSGNDSGLYAPLEGVTDTPPGGVAMAEIDQDAKDTVDDEAGTMEDALMGDSGDLDESTLGESDELSLSDNDELAPGDADKNDSRLDAGPEDLDPFAD